MATIEQCCAPGVCDTPSFSQAVEVTNAQTVLFLAGQRRSARTASPCERLQRGGRVPTLARAAHRGGDLTGGDHTR